MTTCASCLRDLPVGTTAFARDWTVIDISGTEPAYKTRTDYVCDDCEGE